MQNELYYGDNLEIIRNYIKDESVDLVYLDPPFNSKRDYNLLFKTPKNLQSKAQTEAFDDTWAWTMEAELAFDEVMKSGNTDASEMLRAIRKFLGENDMMAYLVMMAVRLLELRRVLKPTGSIYLHCDPVASHYLKILMDAVFGRRNFRNEITWKRTNSHNDAKNKYPNCSDIILFYGKGETVYFNPQYMAHNPEYIKKSYRFDDGDGQGIYRLDNITSPTKSQTLIYEWLGYAPPKKGWRFKRDTMQKMHDDGKIYYPLNEDGTYNLNKRPAVKRYLEEQEGNIPTNVWTDINPLTSQSKESLGYPTQKPVKLLERIIATSSKEGDLVLDPFCGCGTAIHAAQNLNRRWIGIDITNLAISLIEKRITDMFADIKFEVYGTPKDMDGVRALALKDKYQFQWWAISLIKGAVPYGGKKKGADGGIDGFVYFKPDGKNTENAIISVKGGDNVSVAMVRDLRAVIERENAKIGLFITLCEPSKPMLVEAATAGYYETEYGSYPRIQILTIAELFKGAKAQIPLIDSGLKTAVRETSMQNQGDLGV
jgi:site-specific DNA-methyltransferase (adenine-specific)